jgi:hypothetical protein
METARRPGDPKVQPLPFRPAGNGDGWKAWVLLAGVAGTLLGWIGLTRIEPHVAIAVAAAERPLSRTVAAPPRTAAAGERHAGKSRGLTSPAMPQKPVFDSPVTRTRRS